MNIVRIKVTPTLTLETHALVRVHQFDFVLALLEQIAVLEFGSQIARGLQFEMWILTLRLMFASKDTYSSDPTGIGCRASAQAATGTGSLTLFAVVGGKSHRACIRD